MPNWCANELHIFGEPEDIKHFMEANKGLPAKYEPDKWDIERGYTYSTELRFCFNALVPTPQEVLAFGYDGHYKRAKIIEEQGEEAAKGLIDGYNWNIANWGTKWDIYSDNLSLENCGWEEDLTEFILYFDTAWSPPVTWLMKVAPMFPKLRFEMHYEEPGCFFAGDVTCEGDDFTEDCYDDDRCRELFGYLFEDDEDDTAEETEPSHEQSVPVSVELSSSDSVHPFAIHNAWYNHKGVLVRAKLLEGTVFGDLIFFFDWHLGAGIRVFKDSSQLVRYDDNCVTQFYKDTFSPGTMVKVLAMPDDPRPIKRGTTGTVVTVDDIGTLHCNFDNGRHLGLVPGVDKFLKIDSTVYF